MLQEMGAFLKSRKKANLLMVAINAAVFLWMILTGGDPLDVRYMLDHGAMLPSLTVQGGQYYRLITSMFLHFGAEHLLFNMLLLVFAGDMLESRVGKLRYLLIYLGGGLAGNLLSLAVNLSQQEDVPSAGASGAVFAVIGGLVWLIVKNRGRVEGLDSRGVLMMAVLSLIQGFWETGVDHFAHLGGFLGGFVLAAVSGILWAGSRKNT